MKVLEVLQAGTYGSVQDKGRIGFRSFAIPQSGCLDPKMQKIANYLAGNESEAPVLELIGGRFVFKCLNPIMIAIVGIGQTLFLNNNKIDSSETIQLNTSDELIVETQLTCVSIAGTLLVKEHFDSCSTYPLAGLGGRLLKKGYEIEAQPKSISARSIKKGMIPLASTPTVIRVVKGPEWDMVELEPSDFIQSHWEVSKNSNRIGMRLSGPRIEMSQVEMKSVPTFVGTIQLPPDGQPIVLMNDAQTTGGYPRIGHVIKADLPRLARLMMGGTIRFKFVTIEEARYIFQHQQAFIKYELKQSL
jgi:biotin-dependent carboxylase-like uncharacterized protein